LPRKKNHYIPKFYLKNWVNTSGKVWVYRTLVSHDSVPKWKEVSPDRLTSYDHLYNKFTKDGINDDLEFLFDSEIESKAAPSINSAINDYWLTSSDWKNIIKFFQAQDVRTPKRYYEHKEMHSNVMQKIIDDAGDKLKYYLENPEKLDAANKDLDLNQKYPRVPLKMEITNIDEKNSGVKISTSIGRESWIEGIKYLLNEDFSKILTSHRWTILKPFKGLNWITSDCPTIKLNYHKKDVYDFNGGWGSRGTEFLLPLDPNHLLYAKVGEKPPLKGSMVNKNQTIRINHLIAENALRIIISSKKIKDIENIRPRVVDKETFEFEKNEWSKWHIDQSKAEKDFI
jgi:hypothetical protein